MKHSLTTFLLALLLGASSCTASSDKPATGKSGQNDTETVINNIMARRSIRKFTPQTVSRDTLDRIIECGINAPNGMNAQNYEVKVVDDPKSAAYLSENIKGLYKAPVYLFIAANDEYDMAQIDCGLLSENICLAATAYGLGTINLGMPVRSMKEKYDLLDKLGFSAHYNLCLIVALGFPDEAPQAKPRNKEKVQFVKVL
ncbi:nitroreductase [Prevotella sp. PINT]|jgi:Nitroreductase|uniref:nitroreductase family protein n=1 Tax=Palleniella intestinalis TaxID=2736291 RepID=UPI0015555663|nr:nitroreductase [Palleniella intestinalis]NPD81152.1 nitroreductase [Palleniella intestinalis]